MTEETSQEIREMVYLIKVPGFDIRERVKFPVSIPPSVHTSAHFPGFPVGCGKN